MEKESNGFLKEPKQVLVFNAAQVLIAITRSVRSAYELTGGNLQAISFACTGRFISTGGFYFSDIGNLKLSDYDQLCGVTRKYHSVRKMAHNREARINKIKTLK